MPRVAEVELADLEGHCRPRAERIPAGASVAGASPLPQTASARSSAPRRHPAAAREVGGAALEQHRVARDEHALGRDRGRVLLLARVQRVGGDLAALGRAERDQQLEARARGRGRAARAARTRARSAAPATTPARPGTPRPASRSARPRPGRPARCAGRRRGSRAARRSAQLGRAGDDRRVQLVRVGSASASRNASQIASSTSGSVGDRGVRAGRLEPRVGPRERGGEALGVGGGAQARARAGCDSRRRRRARRACVTTPGERRVLGAPGAARARPRGAPREPLHVVLGAELAASRSGSSRSGGCGGRRAARGS